MEHLITKSQAAYQLNIPIHRLNEMEENGEIEVFMLGGEPMVDTFQVSRVSWHAQHVPELIHSQALLAKFEESTY